MLRSPRLNNYLRTSNSILPYLTTNNPSRGSPSATQIIPYGATMASSSRKKTHITPTPKRPKPSALKQHQHSYFSTYVSKHFILAPGEVESFLSLHSVRYRSTETQAIIEECPFCHPTRGEPSNLYALKVERDTGGFKCFRCDTVGKWFDLKKEYSAGVVGPMISDNEQSTTDKSSTNSKSIIQEEKPAPSPSSQESFVHNLWSDNGSVARAYLNDKRGLKDEVLRKYGVGCGKFNIICGRDVKHMERCITFPMYDDHGRLVRHKIRPVETKSGMRLSPKGGGWGIFGLNTVPAEAKSVVLTEGEFDAMSVYQSTGRPAISVPNGANSLPLQLLPFLERFDQIYLWMDEDGPGQTGAEMFSRKLGARRCLSVRGLSVEGKPCKDANDGLQRDIDLEALIQRAEVIPHSALVRFEDIRDQVLADLNNIQDPNVIRSQSIPRLHDLMKGLRPGELTILSGPTGSGKTTLLSQLSLDYCVQNVQTLWGSFEMDNARLAGKLLWQYHAVYSKGKSNLVDKYDYWADRFGELPFYFMRYHGSNPVAQVIETMDFAHYVYDCRHVVLDNLQFMSYGQRTGQFDVMDNAVAQLREFCTRRKVHVTLVVHPRKTEDDDKLQIASVYGSAKATQEADNVLILQSTNQGRLLEVKKNRFDGSVGGISLKFDKKRLMFSQGDSCGGWLGWDDEKKAQERESNIKKAIVDMRAESEVGKGDVKRVIVEEDSMKVLKPQEEDTDDTISNKQKEMESATLTKVEVKRDGERNVNNRRPEWVEGRLARRYVMKEKEVPKIRRVQSGGGREDIFDKGDDKGVIVEEDSMKVLKRQEEDRDDTLSKETESVTLSKVELKRDGERNVNNRGPKWVEGRLARKYVMQETVVQRARRAQGGGGWEGMGTSVDRKLFSSS